VPLIKFAIAQLLRNNSSLSKNSDSKPRNALGERTHNGPGFSPRGNQKETLPGRIFEVKP
jgi:hypothetical protein